MAMLARDSQGYEEMHGDWCFGERNLAGECIIETALAHDLVVINTLFPPPPKAAKHLITCQVRGEGVVWLPISQETL